MDVFILRLKNQLSLLLLTFQSFFWITVGSLFTAFSAFFLLKVLPPIYTPLVLLFSLIGILGGFWMNQASLSFLIPLYFKGKKIESGPLFEKLQKLSPSFCEFTIDCFTIENSPFGKNIFVAGFFPFKPKIFIEKSILSELITSDFEAIFAHELSHIRLNHLKERNSLLIKTLGITIFFTSCILMGLYLMGLVDRLETAAVLSTFIPILFCQIGNKNLIVEQEFEADTLATLVIKHGPEKLTSALTKMIQIQKTEPSEFMKKRIERLAA